MLEEYNGPDKKEEHAKEIAMKSGNFDLIRQVPDFGGLYDEKSTEC